MSLSAACTGNAGRRAACWVSVTVGQWVLIAAVLLVAVAGGWRLRTDGRFRARTARRGEPGTHPGTDPSGEAGDPVPGAGVLEGTSYADRLGERATLLQFSSAFCAPCRATRRVLADVASAVPGVAHVEVDAEEHLDLVRRLGVLRTPTTLVLDGAGAEVTRAAGAPSRPQVLDALTRAV